MPTLLSYRETTECICVHKHISHGHYKTSEHLSPRYPDSYRSCPFTVRRDLRLPSQYRYVSGVITITGTAQKTAWDAGVLPPVERVGPDIWSIPVPIPNNPLRYVIVYVIELPNGVAIVDAGWNTEEAWETLNNGLARAGASMNDVKAILVTHIHPDHYGLAGRVREVSGGWIALHPADAKLIPNRYVDPQQLVEETTRSLRRTGVPELSIEELATASLAIRMFVSTAEPDVLLEDGDHVDLPGIDLTALWTPGHSPGHLCFYSQSRRILLAGDHLLPRITPIVTIHTQQAPDPLGQYLGSLERIRSLGVDEVLPAHEYRFSGLSERVDQLLEHHEKRMTEIVERLSDSPGLAGWDLTRSLSWAHAFNELPLYMQRAAVGEAMAHVVVLEHRGVITRHGTDPECLYLSADAPGPEDQPVRDAK